MDYFLFTHLTDFGEVPDFAIGRASWDNWFVFNALRRNIPTINLTNSTRAYHQNHDYSHVAERRGTRYLGSENDENRRLSGAMLGGFGIGDADYKLVDQKLLHSQIKDKLQTLMRVYKTVHMRKASEKDS